MFFCRLDWDGEQRKNWLMAEGNLVVEIGNVGKQIN